MVFLDEDKINNVHILSNNQDVMTLITIGYPVDIDKDAPQQLEVNDIL